MIAVIIFIEFYFFMINVTNNSTLIAGDRNKRQMNIQSKKNVFLKET